jgi:uncharacterized OB-fold protein
MSETQEKPVKLGRPIPPPAISIETKPFWDAAREGRFMLPRCTDCAKLFWYPRKTCPHCLSANVELVDSPGLGEVYTFSIMRRSPTGPYAIGYVKLDEGVHMMTNFVDMAPSDLQIGLRVKLRFQPTEGGAPAPVFGPA